MHIITHAACVEHLVPDGHPERPDRLNSLMHHLAQIGFTQSVKPQQANAARPEDILRAHPQSYVAELEASVPASGLVPLDPDTWMSPGTHTAALYAAGALCDAVDLVLQGDKPTQERRVFCAVRPPGHHAEQTAAMGFCIYNSVAIAALKALQHANVHKVAILDFDVHHGNGTVDIFKDIPEVLVCSSFQHPHYPNRLFDIARSNIINCPLPAGSGSREFRAVVEHQWLPALEQHQPDLILISAGFDAHQADPLADINLTESDFAWVTREIVQAAHSTSTGGIISTLEGGYDLDALNSSVTAHLEALSDTH